MRRRDYPGWRMVWALAATETISYGVLYYAFAAFLPAMQRSLAYSQTTLAGAFSLSVLVTGAGAIPAGVWLDRRGARGLMTAGSVLAAGSVLLWAQVDSILALYLTFTGMGLAGAAVLYEPAYATVNAYFDTQRQNALLALTMVAGLASTIFVPASSLLITHLGWRHALVVLAIAEGATIVPHFLLVRRRPADQGWQRDGAGRAATGSGPSPGPAREKQPPAGSHADPSRPAYRPVAYVTAAAVLGSAAIAAVAIYLLSYLRQDGYSLAVAAIATGALGVLQVAGRVVLTVSARRVPIAMATALMLGGQAAGVVALLLIRNTAGVVLFVLLFGLGFGVLHIARPDLLAQYAPRPLFARLSGVQALLVIIGEATAPTAAAAMHTITGSYTPMFIAVGACSLAAALLFAAADRAHRKGTGPRRSREPPPGAVRTVRRGGAARPAPRRSCRGPRLGPGRDGPVHRWQLAQFLMRHVAHGDDEVAVLLDLVNVAGTQAAQRQVVPFGGGDGARRNRAAGWVPADAAGTLLARRHSAAARCERAEFAVHTNSTRRAVRAGGRASESSAPGISRT